MPMITNKDDVNVQSRSLPRGADWRKLASKSTRPINAHGQPVSNKYRGLPVLADSIDVHEKAFDLFQKYVPHAARVLDVGAGSGAFTQRLLDHGYQSLEALEVNAEAFQVKEIAVHPLNLEQSWADQLPEPFDALVTLEVIEHLENPWHFARQCSAAIRPGGIVVLSTPNIQSSRSRIEFVLNAEFRFFHQKHFEQIGHMTSMTKNQICQVFSCAGCEFVDFDHSRHKGMPRPTSARKLLRALIYGASYPFMSGAKHGEAGIFVFRRRS